MDSQTVVKEWILREGVCNGRSFTQDELAFELGIPTKACNALINRHRKQLLKDYGLELVPLPALSLQLIISIEAVKRSQHDLELVLDALRARLKTVNDPAESALVAKDLAEAVSTQHRLSRQRDGLIVRIQSEARKREESERAPSNRNISISINGGKL